MLTKYFYAVCRSDRWVQMTPPQTIHFVPCKTLDLQIQQKSHRNTVDVVVCWLQILLRRDPRGFWCGWKASIQLLTSWQTNHPSLSSSSLFKTYPCAIFGICNMQWMYITGPILNRGAPVERGGAKSGFCHCDYSCALLRRGRPSFGNDHAALAVQLHFLDD